MREAMRARYERALVRCSCDPVRIGKMNNDANGNPDQVQNPHDEQLGKTKGNPHDRCVGS